MNFFDLGTATATEKTAVALANSLGLLNLTSRQCPKCESTMNIERGKQRHGIDGRWRCGKVNCRKTLSLFTGSIFNGAHINVKAILRLAYCWCQSMNVNAACQHCEVNEETGTKWYKIFRRIVMLKVVNEKQFQIGGRGCIVEVDETHIFSRKYNVGRVLISEAVWIVGGICRETKEVFLKAVVKRNQANLHKIIVENIVSGSTVITDGWRGYWGVGNNGFIHLSVNHSYYFVDPVNREIHTQHVERVWRSLKESIPKGIRKGDLVDYMCTFIYKRDLPTSKLLSRFNSLVNTIKEYFG
jgi:transposase-like protein